MTDEELQPRSAASRCNSTMIIVYTSAIVVLLGILVPFEYNFGLVNFVRDINKKISSKDESILTMALKKYGYGGLSDNTNLKEKIFTKEELRKYSEDSDVIYLAILGKVYDVTRGKQHYGKDGGYRFFAGKDASRAFVTGEFNEQGLIDSIEELPPKSYIHLFDWMKFYEKDYKYVGKVEGYFYDSDGSAKEGLGIFEKGYANGLKVTLNEQNDRKMFPDCNSKWTNDEGTVVWCSQNSGGIQRNWVGAPRQYFEIGNTNFRCACVEKKYLNDPRFKEYPNCPSDATSCKVN